MSGFDASNVPSNRPADDSTSPSGDGSPARPTKFVGMYDRPSAISRVPIMTWIGLVLILIAIAVFVIFVIL